MSGTEVASTNAFIDALVQRQKWGLRALEDVRDTLNLLTKPSATELLRARAYALAHAMFDDAAIACFNVLVGQKTKTTKDLLKFAQLLVRRAKPEDIARSRKLTSRVLKNADLSVDDRWFALHIAAAAYLVQGEYRSAAETGRKALDEKSDRRTEAFVRLADAFVAGGDLPIETQNSAIGTILSLDPSGGKGPQFALDVAMRAEQMS